MPSGVKRAAEFANDAALAKRNRLEHDTSPSGTVNSRATTQDDGDGSNVKQETNGSKSKCREHAAKGKANASRMPSMLQCILNEQRKSMTCKGRLLSLKDDPNSVMNRPTMTAKSERFKHIRPLRQKRVVFTNKVERKPVLLNAFINKLPPELRTRIYQMAVGSKRHFIYPTSLHGREQPDLAMTCRTIRAEVLAVFYNNNTFALELPSPGPPGSKRSHAEEQVLERQQQWLEIMESAGWLSSIRRWVFVVTAADDTRPTDLTGSDPLYAFVSVEFSPSAAGDADRYPSKIEVHRHAACLTNTATSPNHCAFETGISWLDEMVFGALQEDGVTRLTVKSICEIIEGLELLAEVLMDVRCCPA